MHDQHLIGKMRDLKATMLFVAEKLDERGNDDHAAQMRGAANILQTWIDGIREERSNCNVTGAEPAGGASGGRRS